jgi:hypothetical protein
MLRRLWQDEQGAIVSSEILVIATILVLGLMAAWAAVRNAVITQIEEQACWIAGEEDCPPPQFTSGSVEGSGYQTFGDLDN